VAGRGQLLTKGVLPTAPTNPSTSFPNPVTVVAYPLAETASGLRAAFRNDMVAITQAVRSFEVDC
jgi:hypothetical protein